jgi:intracellular sulfur oxidation DsrE/DsrF family protein
MGTNPNRIETPGNKAVFHHALLASMVLLGCAAFAFAQSRAADPLHIDIPTTLEKTNVVVDFGHAVFNGDMPFALGDVNLLVHDAHAWNASGNIVVIFHGDAAYMVLNDESYNANRHATGGNPYKKALDSLMAQGVQLELCGATAKGNHWGNADLLPGIKVNVNAMVRVTQLEQGGYTLIYE